jgi:hypothetical protein
MDEPSIGGIFLDNSLKKCPYSQPLRRKGNEVDFVLLTLKLKIVLPNCGGFDVNIIKIKSSLAKT